jgi:stage II sporulation protein D
MNATGRKITTRDSVVAMTARLISRVASPVDLRISSGGLFAGNELCTMIEASKATVRLQDGEDRSYPGRLRVTLEGSALRFITSVDVEDYLVSVVASEMGAALPAAVEAQAIVSRTFALASRRRHARAGYDLCDLTHCQLFRGHAGETSAARAAVKKTQGTVLFVGGILLRPAHFHAACGGHTSRSTEVFQEQGSGAGVSDLERGAALCGDAENFAWTWTVERNELARALGLNPAGGPFEPLRRDEAGRVIELRSFGRRFSGSEYLALIGRSFGYQVLRSMRVSAEEVESLIRFSGTGLGHGVGLCQQGAKSFAKSRVSSYQILKRYFPDSTPRAYSPPALE